MNLDTAEGANLLNVQYGVCFGVLFTFCFRVAGDQAGNHVSLAIPIAQAIPFATLLTYFFLDWALANFLRNKIQFSFSRTLAWSVAIWILGAAVALTLADKDPSKYVLLSVYSSAVSLYHLYSYSSYVYRISTGARVFGLLLVVAPMTLLAAYFGYVTVMHIVGVSDPNGGLERTFLSVSFGFLLVKTLNVGNLVSATHSE